MPEFLYPPDSLYDSHPQLWEFWLSLTFFLDALPSMLLILAPFGLGLFALFKLADKAPKVARIMYLVCIGISAVLSSYAVFIAFPWMIGYNAGRYSFVVVYLVVVGLLPLAVQVPLFARSRDLKVRKALILTILYTPIVALGALMIMGVFGLDFATD